MILIVDDDASVAASLTLALKQAGYPSRCAATQEEALLRLSEESFDLVLQDMNFSRKTTGEEGLALLKKIKAVRPGLPVILITAWGSIPLAVQGMRAGAADFITKPWSNEYLLQSVRTALGLAGIKKSSSNEKPMDRDELDRLYDFREILGADPGLLSVLALAGKVSATEASVLITGESGTGKELVAEALHRNSTRRRKAFVKVNLGGISSTLFESEMFGHVRGAFTDAYHDREGRFASAHGGTIFLDEVGDLDPGSQVKLLRVLQDRTYEVLGSSTTRRVDVRVVSATNRPLHEMTACGDFREDLLYRLNLITLHLPPLRERKGDIPQLANSFLYAAGQSYGIYQRSLSTEAIRWLQAQPWPGNIRQLRHTVERALLVSRGATLEIPDFVDSSRLSPSSRETDRVPEVGAMTIEEMEKAMIEKTMWRHGGNISRVAETLGLSRTALYRRLEKHGIKTQ